MISTFLMVAMTAVGGHKGCCKTSCSSACSGSCYSACSGSSCSGGWSGCYSSGGCYSSCSGGKSKCHGGCSGCHVKKSKGCCGCHGYSACSSSCSGYQGCTTSYGCTSGCTSGCAHGAAPVMAPAPAQVKKAPDGKAMAPIPDEFKTVAFSAPAVSYSSEPVVVYAE